jgi:small subunit ribosomal protein S18
MRSTRKDRGSDKKKRRGPPRRKVCPFCADRNVKIDYKNPSAIKRLVTERGKIVPRRISGVCAKHQRQVALAIKRARHIALMPYAATGAAA